jgi:formylglycine-generating enzyme required for sulfatase activity
VSTGCTYDAGPTMVFLDAGFCIDSTEVTNNQYLAFLVAAHGDTSGQIPACSWNTTYAPGTPWPAPTGQESNPVANVDWCDAYAYCRWAGKRLCGAVGGGTVPTGQGSMAGKDQWYTACSHFADSIHDYPTGNTYDIVNCNNFDHEAGATVPVASLPCEGGYDGIFDMAGNVREWEDFCDTSGGDAGGAKDNCITRGGSYHESYQGTRCDAFLGYGRQTMAPQMGFRCCSNP